MYQIRCRETGDEIIEVDTLEEAEEILEHYAHIDMLEDMPEGQTKPSGDIEKHKEFYEIVEVTAD